MEMYITAAQQAYIHVTNLHAKNMVNDVRILAKFFKTTQKREVKIVTNCLSDLADMRLEEKRFWKEEQIPRLKWKSHLAVSKLW